MSLDRWDPFREMMNLREAMDRVFQQSFIRSGQTLFSRSGETIPVDLVDQGDAFEVTASIPGAKPEDVEITIDGSSLTLRAETHSQEEHPGETWVMREQRYGQWQRVIALPGPVDADRTEGHVENGLLTLRLPKAPGSTPRRVPLGGSALGQSKVGAGAQTPPPPTAAPGKPGSGSNAGTANDQGQGGSDRSAGGDLVTEQSQESFPASDPPSWTPEKT